MKKSLLYSIFERIPPYEKRITFATVLTIGRMVISPIIVFAVMMHCFKSAFGLFIIAAVTDFLDGFFARYCNQKTLLGACLDPLADKILIASCLTALFVVDIPAFAIAPLLIIVFFIKEAVQVIGAAYLLYKSHSFIEPTFLGKATTVMHLSFIVLLFVRYFTEDTFFDLYRVISTALLFTIIASSLQYIFMGLTSICAKRTIKRT